MSRPNSGDGASWLLGGLVALAGCLPASAAVAAESFDGCEKRTITSLPATITTPGRWCLTTDLSTAIASGAAIHIAANNVVLDCNGFRLTDASTAGTQATGVRVAGRNATVVGCRIRGFQTGLAVFGDAALVDGNAVRGSARKGIQVMGDGGTVRDNVVVDIGDDADIVTASPRQIVGIAADGSVDVIGNLVHGVANRGSHAGESAFAVRMTNARGVVASGNRLRSVYHAMAYPAHSEGIRVGGAASGVGVVGNDFSGVGLAVHCTTASAAILRDNTLHDADTSLQAGCIIGGGNAQPIVE